MAVNPVSGAFTGAASQGFNPVTAPLAAYSGWQTGIGIGERDEAEQAALRAAMEAQMRYYGGLQQLGTGQERMGNEMAQQWGQNSLDGYQAQADFARQAPSAVANEYAKSLQMAQAYANQMGQGGNADLRSAAQKAYAGQIAQNVGQRTNAGMHLGMLQQGQSKVAGQGMRVGDSAALAQAGQGNTYQQFQAGQGIQKGILQRNYANEMGSAGLQAQQAETEGGMRMMTGQLVNTGLQMGFGAAGSMHQAGLANQHAAQQKQLQDTISKYYSAQTNRLNDQRAMNDASGGPYAQNWGDAS